MIWVDTQLMLADVLTKKEVTPEYLRDAFSLNQWSSRSTEATLQKKAWLQTQRRKRKQAKRSP